MVGQKWRYFATVLAVLLWSVPTAASIACYNPDGSQAKGDVPCTSDATTFCCYKGDVCMSNGLCHLQGKRGFVLSRASCTDRSWDSCGSYKYCMPYNKKSGFPIVAAHYNGSKTEHCCGTASWDNKKKKTDCGSFKSVSVPSGTAIPGVAGLAMNSSSSTNTSSTATPVPMPSDSGSNTSRETAIGVGVGVPLGLIALASIAWALWERRSRLHAASNVPPTYVEQPSTRMVYQLPADDRPAELGSSVVSELANSDQHKSHVGSER